MAPATPKDIQVFVDGQAVPTDIIRDEPLLNISFNQGELQVGNKEWGTPFKGQLSDLRFYDRRLYANEVSELAILSPLQKLLEVPYTRRSEPQREWLRNYFVTNVANPHEKQEKQDLVTLNRGLTQLNREIPSTMVMSDMAKPRDTFVLSRGDYRLQPTKSRPTPPPFFLLFQPTLLAIASLSPGGLSIPPTRSPPASPSIIFGKCISASAS